MTRCDSGRGVGWRGRPFHTSSLARNGRDKVHTKTTTEAFDRKRVQGVGSGERTLRTTERPAHVAKNRVGLPDELPLDYRLYAASVRGEDLTVSEPEPAAKGA